MYYASYHTTSGDTEQLGAPISEAKFVCYIRKNGSLVYTDRK